MVAKMNKHFGAVALLLTLCVGLCSGCFFRQPAAPEGQVNFPRMTQPERKEYINEYLWKTYGVRGDVSDVEQRQIDYFDWEDYYEAYVRLPDQSLVDVWVTYGGEITDSMFLRDWKEPVNQYFEGIVKKEFPECRMTAYTLFCGRPSAELQEGDDIGQYLREQPACSSVRIFMDRSTGADERVLDRLEEVLKGQEVDLLLYLCDDVNSIDLDHLEQYSYTYGRRLYKPVEGNS